MKIRLSLRSRAKASKIAFQMPRWLHGKAGLDRDALAIALRQVTPVARAEAAAVQYGSVRNPAQGRSPASENAAQSPPILDSSDQTGPSLCSLYRGYAAGLFNDQHMNWVQTLSVWITAAPVAGYVDQ